MIEPWSSNGQCQLSISQVLADMSAVTDSTDKKLANFDYSIQDQYLADLLTEFQSIYWLVVSTNMIHIFYKIIIVMLFFLVK